MGIIILVALSLCSAGILWKRWRSRHRHGTPLASGAISRETLALQAFTHGNRRLAAGRFDEARAAFQEVLTLNPKHPYIAGRLAEVERQRHAARAMQRLHSRT